MRATLDETCVLHVIPENTTELVALKYWVKEFLAHGVKMLEVSTSVSDGVELLEKHTGSRY